MDMFYFRRLLCRVFGHSSTRRRLGGDYCKRCGKLLVPRFYRSTGWGAHILWDAFQEEFIDAYKFGAEWEVREILDSYVYID